MNPGHNMFFVLYTDTARTGRWTSKQNLPYESAHVSCEVAPAGRWAEIFLRVEPVRVDHEVTICQVAGMKRENHTEDILISYVYGAVRASEVLTFLEILTCSSHWRIQAKHVSLLSECWTKSEGSWFFFYRSRLKHDKFINKEIICVNKKAHLL